MNIARLFLLAAASAAAFLSASSAWADDLPSRDQVLKLMNAKAPFDNFHTIYVCDTSSLGAGVQKASVDWHFSKGKDAALLKLCRGGEVSALGKNSNLNSDTVGVFFNEKGRAAMQGHLGAIATTTSFDGYDHHYIYGSPAPLDLGKNSNGFATAEPAEAPFVKLTLKTLRYRVGTIEGVREPVMFSPEHECSAVADYTYEILEPAPWAQTFIEAYPKPWREPGAVCLVKYDDGWRIKKWNLNQ